LSGGEHKQLVLDLLFASDADVLLLDEPDNFLDVPAKRGLERRVRATKTIVMISHDPEILANAVGTIVTLEGNGAWVHGGSYATYAQAREDRQRRLGDAVKRWNEEALERGGAAAVSPDEDLQGARPLCARLGQAGRRHGITVLAGSEPAARRPHR
jgi:ATPase subunit of ABC transporter with duplicated ATPase domains